MKKEVLKPEKKINYFEGNEWQLPPDIGIVGSAVDEFRRRLADLKWEEEDIDWLTATFEEVLVNAIVHGSLNIKEKSEEESWRTAALREQEKGGNKKPVHVKLDLTPDKITIIVRDEGEGFDWRKQFESEGEDLTKTSGRGMLYMKMNFDSFSYNEKGNEVTMIKERDRVAELFTKIGINIEKTNPNIIRKLRLLDRETKTFKDEEKAIHIAQALFKYYETKLPDKKFSKQEMKTVLIGTVFADIGKTGPRNATSEQEEVVLGIYNIENIIDPNKITLAQFVGDNFPKDADNRLATLKELGIDGNITMREFYNLHARWTLEIISGDGVPAEAVAAAATHHILEGINPEEIVGKDGRFTRYFGDNVSFDRAERLIIILDKYDAARRRGEKTHKEAIEFVRNKVKSNPDFSQDEEFGTLLNDLDAMISADSKIYGE